MFVAGQLEEFLGIMSTPPVPTIAPYVNPAGFPSSGLPNEGYKVWLALVIMIISSGIFVTARITHRYRSRQLGADDYVIVAALVRCLDLSPFDYKA